MPSQFDDLNKTSRKLFEHLGRNPGTWALSGERLKKAADGLRQSAWPAKRGVHDSEAATADFMIGPVYMLLVGLAVENVLKAMVIAQEPENIERQKLSKFIRRHDLGSFWDCVGLRRCAEYDRELKRLEAFVVTFGRYPVTSLKRDMDTMVTAGFHGEVDFRAVDRLWAFLRSKFTKLCPDIPLED